MGKGPTQYSSHNVGSMGLQKSGDYSWGGLMDTRDRKQAEANAARMQGQIDQTERKLMELSAQRPGYSFAYGSPEFQSLRSQLSSGGPLETFEKARGLLDLKSRQNIDRQTADLAGQQAGAYSQLAMGGGLSSGARERIAQGGLLGNIQARQALRGETQSQYADLAGREAQEKLALQQQIANIAAQEEQRRQQMEMERWKTEMETRAAIEKSRQQAQATAASCFAPGTMITMEDGSEKPIQQVKIGDRVKMGGEVYCTQMAKYGHSCYEYNGVHVTGQHAVFEDGKWVRIKDAKKAVSLNYNLTTVYNLGVETHKLIVNGVLFSDLHETDSYEFATDEECLAELNKSMPISLTAITEHNEQPGTKVY